jgi:hypothetical protein
MHDIERLTLAAGGGCGRSSAMSRNISWNICRGIATSAIWKITAAVAHHLRADLDQLVLQGRQRTSP